MWAVGRTNALRYGKSSACCRGCTTLVQRSVADPVDRWVIGGLSGRRGRSEEGYAVFVLTRAVEALLRWSGSVGNEFPGRAASGCVTVIRNGSTSVWDDEVVLD